MVSKTVVVAFVALCCAQAFAAPRNEEFTLGAHQLGSGFSECVTDLFKSLSLIKDLMNTVDEIKTIVSTNNAAAAACTADQDATEEAVKECKMAAQKKLASELKDEVTKVKDKATAIWTEIYYIIHDCA